MARVSRHTVPAAPAMPAPGSITHAAQPVTNAVVAAITTPPVTVTQDSVQFRAFLANSVCGIVGISGAGKTSLATTAVEEAWEVYGAITLWYAADLGGWGTRLRSLIKHGICRAWYMRNHINPFDTMQYASLGYWPAHIIDPENGFTAPDVRLIAPRAEHWTMVCVNGHPVTTQPGQAQMLAVQMACPTCGQITNASNASGITRALVRPALFKSVVGGTAHVVGHRVYDSMTQINEWGAQMLKDKSARGDLPSGSSGGSALGSADAIRERDFTFGTGSMAQVGFMQNRTPEWIANIRSIPDQVLPATMTFGVEQSKGDDESGGMPVLGPKIEGNKRTSSVPGWLGNCLYAAKEPHNPPEIDAHGNVKLYHRLWLTTHVDPRDARGIPIMAKHRGEPLGMPPFLEDDADKPELAWERCSLRVFYGLLRKQAEVIEARDAARYPDAPGLDAELGEDDVMESGVVSLAGGTPGALPVVQASGGRRRRGAPMPTAALPAAPVAQGAPVVAPISEQPAAVATDSAHVSVAISAATDAAPAEAGTPRPVAVPATRAESAAPPATTPVGGRVARRTPRPPV